MLNNFDKISSDIDLFLELNGLWTHGGKPFEGSEDDMKLVEYWKSKGRWH